MQHDKSFASGFLMTFADGDPLQQEKLRSYQRALQFPGNRQLVPGTKWDAIKNVSEETEKSIPVPFALVKNTNLLNSLLVFE